MAKLKVSGSASGTGTITLIAPATSTDRTITLPDESITLGGGVDGIVSTADATAITIDSSENVGFGVTPTTYYSGYTGVQIGTNGTLYGQTAAGASNNFWVGQNVRAGTDGSEKAITTGVSSQMMQSGGAVVFKTGASASADANVTWTTTLDLKADGRGLSKFTAFAWANIGLDNVAAGNTSPDGSLNISTVTLQSTGVARFNYTNSSSSNNVAAVGTHNTAGGTMNWNGSTSSYLQFTCYHSNGNTESASGVNIVSFGGN
jgi:hypothetical protein